MKIVVQGMWHLGCVTAACLAEAGHEVVGLDFDPQTVDGLSRGKAPLFEPGLNELLASGLASGKLQVTNDAAAALAAADVLWVTYDTPVDDDDRADVEFVLNEVRRVFEHIADGVVVVASSQLPVGSIAQLEREFASRFPGRTASFACSPENLRLGKALEVFRNPDRVVIGVRDDHARERLAEVFAPFHAAIEWMRVESAEMVKHALNSFLAASVTFANEIATLCECTGAEAKEVERGLKSEARIGPKAYLSPGVAFAGGTLARDIAFLNDIGAKFQRPTHLLSAVKKSNDAHRLWIRNKLREVLGCCRGRTVAVWGLTYKPGTDTLRRSSSVELCRWLADEGAIVRTHDPAVKVLPDELADRVLHTDDAVRTLDGAEALVISTPWPDYTAHTAADVAAAMRVPRVIDPTRFLAARLADDARILYSTIGRPAA